MLHMSKSIIKKLQNSIWVKGPLKTNKMNSFISNKKKIVGKLNT